MSFFVESWKISPITIVYLILCELLCNVTSDTLFIQYIYTYLYLYFAHRGNSSQTDRPNLHKWLFVQYLMYVDVTLWLRFANKSFKATMTLCSNVPHNPGWHPSQATGGTRVINQLCSNLVRVIWSEWWAVGRFFLVRGRWAVEPMDRLVVLLMLGRRSQMRINFPFRGGSCPLALYTGQNIQIVLVCVCVCACVYSIV